VTPHDHADQSAQAHSAEERPAFDEGFWDERYGSMAQVWSGNPNPQLVTEVAELAAGVAIDIGAGEGADAIWLAERGWTVIAVDISDVALERGRRRADEVGVADRITWAHADVTEWAPPPADLVSLQFMQMPAADREPLFARCAAAVRSGGTLLIVAHHPSDMNSGVKRPKWPELFYTAEEVASTLDPSTWTIVATDARPRAATGVDGATLIHDAVLVARRR